MKYKGKKFFIIILLILFVSVVCLITRQALRLKNTFTFSDDTTKVIALETENIYELPEYEEKSGFTCTGLTYDEKNKSYWVGNYGKYNKDDQDIKPSIIQVTQGFSKILSVIQIEDEKADIQGVSYDSKTDTLWYADGVNVINIDKSGNEISKFGLGQYTKYKSNGITYNYKDDTLWVLCFYNYLLHFDRCGHLLNSYESSYIGQDHLEMIEDKLCFSVGEDYDGDQNYVAVYDPENMNVSYAYKVKGSYAIEGVCYHDGKLYVANDGVYHNAKLNEDVVVEYDIGND